MVTEQIGLDYDWIYRMQLYWFQMKKWRCTWSRCFIWYKDPRCFITLDQLDNWNVYYYENHVKITSWKPFNASKVRCCFRFSIRLRLL